MENIKGVTIKVSSDTRNEVLFRLSGGEVFFFFKQKTAYEIGQ